MFASIKMPALHNAYLPCLSTVRTCRFSFSKLCIVFTQLLKLRWGSWKTSGLTSTYNLILFIRERMSTIFKLTLSMFFAKMMSAFFYPLLISEGH